MGIVVVYIAAPVWRVDVGKAAPSMANAHLSAGPSPNHLSHGSVHNGGLIVGGEDLNVNAVGTTEVEARGMDGFVSNLMVCNVVLFCCAICFCALFTDIKVECMVYYDYYMMI